MRHGHPKGEPPGTAKTGEMRCLPRPAPEPPSNGPPRRASRNEERGAHPSTLPSTPRQPSAPLIASRTMLGVSPRLLGRVPARNMLIPKAGAFARHGWRGATCRTTATAKRTGGLGARPVGGVRASAPAWTKSACPTGVLGRNSAQSSGETCSKPECLLRPVRVWVPIAYCDGFALRTVRDSNKVDPPRTSCGRDPVASSTSPQATVQRSATNYQVKQMYRSRCATKHNSNKQHSELHAQTVQQGTLGLTHGCHKAQVGRHETNGVAPVMRRKEQLQEGSVSKLLNSMHTCRFTAPQPHIATHPSRMRKSGKRALREESSSRHRRIGTANSETDDELFAHP